MEYTVKIFKIDRRCKAGKKLFIVNDIEANDDDEAEILINAMQEDYPEDKYNITFAPKYITVTNLMSGQEVQIAADTPWYCRPDSESYWSS